MKKIGILGLGTSGFWSAVKLAKSNKIFISEIMDTPKIRKKIKQLPPNIEFELGKHTERLLECDFVIKSPGIPSIAPIIKKLKSAGIPIYDEIEIVYQLTRPKKLIAITGTNGKTTVVSLLGKIFKEAKLQTIVAGNIGQPFIKFLENFSPEIFIIMEVSSFQLENIKEFKPNISAILNITEDHLEEHGSFSAYVKAKSRIFENQKKKDWCVLNYDDKYCRALAEKIISKKVFFTLRGPLNTNFISIEDNMIYGKIEDTNISLDLSTKLTGEHNLMNILCAVAISYILRIPKNSLLSAIKKFKGLPHRIEFVRKLNGVTFINDSKSTNVSSTEKAIRSLQQPIHLIIGGKDKHLNYSKLKPIIAKKVKCLYLIGETVDKFAKLFHNSTKIYKSYDLKNAVRTAYKNAKNDEIVMLSPATSSFDQFKNFADRGNTFKREVMKL